MGQRRWLKKPWAGEEENKNALLGCVGVQPQNGLNGLILNWCTGGCWFTPAILKSLCKNEMTSKVAFIGFSDS